jgi:trehalose 6-phosphate phosphatase
MLGILRPVPAPTAEMLAEAMRPLTEDPRQAAVFCDIDGTLAPIVRRADEAKVDERISRLLGTIARRYRCTACISGRSAAEARRLVGVGGIAYAGTHGAELLLPTATRAVLDPDVARGADRVRAFTRENDTRELRRLRVRIEDKGSVMAFHWRGAPDEDAALERVQQLAQAAEEDGLHVHWGRKVLEVRPPVPISKGRAIRELVSRFPVRVAMFAGDDATDLDAFDALDELVAIGTLEAAVRVGISSDEGPAAIVERADLVMDGVEGFRAVLEVLAAT